MIHLTYYTSLLFSCLHAVYAFCLKQKLTVDEFNTNVVKFQWEYLLVWKGACKVLVVAGAGGFFGAYIMKAAAEKNIPAIGLYHSDAPEGGMNFDICNDTDVENLSHVVKENAPCDIIWLIASHNPDFVGEHPDEAYNINVTRLGYILDRLDKSCVRRFILASSDTVYGESRGAVAFCENDKTEPVNIYGEHKLCAEREVLSRGYTAARFPYMYGKSLCEKKHFFDELLCKLENGERIYMLTDYVRSALSYEQAAEKVIKLLEIPPYNGCVNICGDKAVSKYDIGLEAAALAGVSDGLVVPTNFEQLGIFKEKRAAVLLMNGSLFKNLTKNI